MTMARQRLSRHGHVNLRRERIGVSERRDETSQNLFMVRAVAKGKVSMAKFTRRDQKHSVGPSSLKLLRQ